LAPFTLPEIIRKKNYILKNIKLIKEKELYGPT